MTTQGSSLTSRSQTDGDPGHVYIYVGAPLPAGTTMVQFQFLFDLSTAGNTTAYITPLLFEYKSDEAFTIYTVAGIGKGFEVTLNALAQAIPFSVLEGTTVTTGGNFTFGYINALVGANGVPVVTSPGGPDYDIPPMEAKVWAAKEPRTIGS